LGRCLGGGGAGELLALVISRLRLGMKRFGAGGSGRGYTQMNADFWCLGGWGAGEDGGSGDFPPAVRKDMFWEERIRTRIYADERRFLVFGWMGGW